MGDFSILRSIISLRYIITVEPIFLTYIASLALQKPLLQQFIYDFVSKSSNFTGTQRNELCAPSFPQNFNNSSILFGFDETNSDLINLENKAQAKTSYLLLLLSTTSTIPSVFVSLVYGAWTDRVGRKPLLILCLAGFVVQNTAVICVVNYDLPYYLLFIGSAIDGLCGSFSCIMLCGFAYISDITDSKNRAFRIGLLEAMIYVGATLSFFVSGVWVKESGGYKQPFWGALAMALFALLYTVIVLPASKQSTDTQRATRVNPFQCSSVKSMLDLIRQRPVLCAGLVAFLLIVFALLNDTTIIYLKAHPICWSAVLIGVWYGLQTGIKAAGLVVGTKIFQRLFSDPVMILIGVISTISSCVTFGLAKSTLVLFLSLLPGVFQAMSSAGCRTVLSKLTPSDKQGLMFSAVGVIESLATFLAPLLYNTVYPVSRSVLHFPQLCFYLTAVIQMLAIPLVLVVYYKGVLSNKYQSSMYSTIPDDSNNSNLIDDADDSFEPVNS